MSAQLGLESAGCQLREQLRAGPGPCEAGVTQRKEAQAFRPHPLSVRVPAPSGGAAWTLAAVAEALSQGSDSPELPTETARTSRGMEGPPQEGAPQAGQCRL